VHRGEPSILHIQLGDDFVGANGESFSEEDIETGARLSVVPGIGGRQYAEFDAQEKAAVVAQAHEQLLQPLSHLSTSELTGLLLSCLDDYVVDSGDEADEEYEVYIPAGCPKPSEAKWS